MPPSRPSPRHPYIPELQGQLRRGAISRRQFLRTVPLPGVSVGAASAMLGQITGPWPVRRAVATGKRGGNLRCSSRVEMTDPAKFNWVEQFNQARQIVAYLTITGSATSPVPTWPSAGRHRRISKSGRLPCVAASAGPTAMCLRPMTWAITLRAGSIHGSVHPTSGYLTP